MHLGREIPDSRPAQSVFRIFGVTIQDLFPSEPSWCPNPSDSTCRVSILPSRGKNTPGDVPKLNCCYSLRNNLIYYKFTSMGCKQTGISLQHKLLGVQTVPTSRLEITQHIAAFPQNKTITIIILQAAECASPA